MFISKNPQKPEWLSNHTTAVYETKKAWENYFNSHTPKTLSDYQKLNTLVLTNFMNECQYANKFEDSCYAIIENHAKLDKIMQVLPVNTSYEKWENYCIKLLHDIDIPFHKDFITSLNYFIYQATEIETEELIYQFMQRILLERVEYSRHFAKEIRYEFGPEIYNQVLDGITFVQEAMAEVHLIQTLREVFPNNEELSDDELLKAFQQGQFDNILGNLSIYEYAESINEYANQKEALEKIIQNLTAVYGLEDKATKECQNLMLTSQDGFIEKAKKIIKQTHGSIGLRKVIQYGQESADVKDMEHFEITSKIYGKEKAEELLRLTRKTVAENWEIPYDDELLNTPIDEWKDNPGR